MSNATVGTTAVNLVSFKGSVSIFNNGSATIYVDGVPGVTTSSGLPIGPATGWTIAADDVMILYAVSGTAGQDVRFLVGAS